MGDATGISWTDATWNPWRGCTRVSPGCDGCYMIRDQRRYGRDPLTVVRCAPGTFGAPLKWEEPRLVFTCSWSDWFHVDADPWREEAWAVVRACPQHTFQILTKRPGRIPRCLPDDWGDGYPNVWLGTSIEGPRFSYRARQLAAAPAALRFLSCEPFLAPLFPMAQLPAPQDRVLPGIPGGVTVQPDAQSGEGRSPGPPSPLDLSGVSWIIAGGESGPSRPSGDIPAARPMHPAWARAIRDAALAACPRCLGAGWYADHEDACYEDGGCSCAGVQVSCACPERPRFHMKQWGSHSPVMRSAPRDGDVWVNLDGTLDGYDVGDAAERDEYGYVVRGDGSGAALMRYAGPKPTSGGKTLDGVDWCEIPERASAVPA